MMTHKPYRIPFGRLRMAQPSITFTRTATQFLIKHATAANTDP
ncbi:MAG: hypothetical protein ABJM43_13725 [Paracoccaceae bacterium]